MKLQTRPYHRVICRRSGPAFPRRDFERFLCSYSKLLRVIRVAQTGNLVISSGFLIIWMDERVEDS
jgi:hypothetical protein